MPSSPRASSIPPAFAADITAAAGPVDVTLELVGGDYLVTDIAVAAPRGRIVLIGLMAGARAQLDLAYAHVQAAATLRHDAPRPLGRREGGRDRRVHP